ncbi:MAG: DNA polymerase I [Bifidobacteriaceae bacterium]|jgi:DNA polymerase-1|nr:DNA polymerase I [Bifidobacteriaceae bacterium]MCI1978535.1 DNA polymerase I [Bifidobacteriaceae bacterium]
MSSTTDTTSSSRPRLLVVDGHSLAFRAFFALPAESFSTKTGQSTNAVYGFFTMLADVVKKEKPTHLGVAFDVAGGTFRNQMLTQYKATRDVAPEELLSQLPLIQKLLDALSVTYITKKGFEGDDLIASLATLGENNGYESLVLSGDRDAFQLIDDNITVLYPGHHFKDLKHMDPQAVLDKYKVTPQQYPDLAALRGETSDNIPGVPGVGDGYAAKWINQFGGLQEIIDHADEITGKKGQALRENLDQVQLNRRVNALVRDVDMGITLDELKMASFDVSQLDAVLKELEFSARTRANLIKAFGAAAPAGVNFDGAKGSSITVGSDGTVSSDAAGGEQGEDSDTSSHMVEPILDTEVDGSDTARFEQWLSAHVKQAAPAPTQTPSVDSLVAFNDPRDAQAEEQGQDSHTDEESSAQTAIANAVTLTLEGTDDPGKAKLKFMGLLAPDDHLVILNASTMDSSSRALLEESLAQHAYITYGYKEALLMAGAADITLTQPVFDTRLAAYLVSPDFQPETIEKTGTEFLDEDFEAEAKAAQPTQGALDLGEDEEEADSKGEQENMMRRVAIVEALARTLAPILDQRKQYELLWNMELPVSKVLASMEIEGAQVDQNRLAKIRADFGSQADQAEAIAVEAAGREINLQSPKQLQSLLFEDMGLSPTRKTKTGYTTNAAALQELYIRSVHNERANTFLGALLRYRETNKLKQIVQTLIEAVNVHDGRIHTTFEQTIAATGRLSSTNPNLQNIPNRNIEGREIRSVFVPGEGFTNLLSSDYSQVELRIMAHLSGDEALIHAFQTGADFHKYVASLVYQVPVEEITSDQRSHIKAMSYGLAYGLSTYGLAQQLKISPAEADILREKYFSTFGKVHDYLESLVSEAKKKGYTETMFGRRRYFPALRSTSRTARSAAERAALNAPIQGSAADIMKIAMVKAGQALDEAGVKSRIILQIHDELVVEIAAGEEEQVTELVKNAMEHAVSLDVPLDVSTGLGSDWQSAAH